MSEPSKGFSDLSLQAFSILGISGILVHLRHLGDLRHFSQGGDVEKLRTQWGDKVAEAFDKNSMRGEKR